MNEIVESVSNREWAYALWLCVIAIAVLFYKPARGPLKSLVGTFFQPVIIIPLVLAGIYAAGEIYLLDRIGWWSLANLKSTILWLVTFAFVAMFEMDSIKKRKVGMGKVARDIFAITSIFLFITELHSFPLIVELAVLPVVTFFAIMGEVAKHKPEHASVAKLLGCIMAIIGLAYFGFSVVETIDKWSETATRETALDFLLPILLSVGFLPFLYAWRLYVIYSEIFATMGVVGIDKELVPYARWLAMTHIRGDVETLERWRKAILTSRPTTKPELKHSLTALFALQEREDSPPIVPPSQGWSPYLAIQFMCDLGYDTGHYHNGFVDEWFASSPMREFGDDLIWKNNIAYYVEGREHAATTVKLKLNINDPEQPDSAEQMFIVGCMHLLEQAISMDAVERMKLRIAELEPFSAEIPFGEVTLSKDDFIGGIEGGYSRTFCISRGSPDGAA